jgi:hypothetical protein
MIKTERKRPRKILQELQHGAELETMDAMDDHPAIMKMLRRLV